MEPTITGAEAAERAAEYLELKGETNAIRGGAYATLALALATAGQWNGPVALTELELCGHESPSGAVCSRPAGHDTDGAENGHDVHTGHLAGTFRVWQEDAGTEWAPGLPEQGTRRDT